MNIADNQHLSPILWAVINGHTNIVKKILFIGTGDVNTISREGETLLHISIRYGHLQIASDLIDTDGIEINAQTEEYGFTPLHLACYYGHIGLASKLIIAGANLTLRDRYDGKTALAYILDETYKARLVELNPNKESQSIEEVDVDIYTRAS